MASNPQPSGAQPFWPPVVGSTGPPPNFGTTISVQFHPVPQQPPHPFMMATSQQFRPVGQGISVSNAGIPPQGQQLQYPQLGQPPLPPRSGQPGYGLPPLSQAVSYAQPNRSLTSTSLQPQQNTQPLSNHMPGPGGLGVDISSSYSFAPPPYGQPQNNMNASSQYQPISQMYPSVTPVSGQPSLVSGNQNTFVPMQTISQPPPVTAADVTATNVNPNATVQSSDWIEHTNADGRRYYYNKKTRQSSWEKPLELMTPIERADASTNWKEFTSPDGRTYFYNKITKQSKWIIPEELKLARQQAKNGTSQDMQSEIPAVPQVPQVPQVPAIVSTVEAPAVSDSAVSVSSSPVLVVPASSATNPLPAASASPSVPVVPSTVPSNSIGGHSPVATVTPSPIAISGNAGVSTASETTSATARILENVSPQPVVTSADGASLPDLEEAKKGMAAARKAIVTSLEEKVAEAEHITYASKQEAKDAFKALLDSANVESDWTWEKAMRVIINDKRYGSLRTLGERKQAFSEYLIQRKNKEVEERRIKQRKAREDFIKMLEESKDLTSSTKWSKAETIFEDDERFRAVERVRDREEFFDSYLAELKKKERAKAHEEHKRNIMEYKQFLQSCDFIKANSQWRRVQDRLEQDNRCSCLEKFERLEIFQEFVNDLEKEEEEKRKIQKEQLRRSERNSRDEFRKLMEGHVATGILTAKTHWRDYCMKVKDLPAYVSVSSNTAGATPKDLFEDVAEDLEKQYREDKTRIKDAVKLGKITMSSTWTFEEFKAAILEEIRSSPISDTNLKLVFDDMLEKIKEKEEKEAKKRQILADDFSNLLYSIKEINASSKWEGCKPFLEDSQEYRSIGEESFMREIFEGYVTLLQEKANEKERKRLEEKAKKDKERADKEKRREKDRKEKERREKERERGRDKGDERSKSSEKVDVDDVKESRRRDKEKDRKHRKRHQSVGDEVSSEKEDKDDSKRPRRHRSEHKKSKKHTHGHDSDSESKHKRHKRGHRHDSYRNGGHPELEDGELGEDEVTR